MMMLFSLLLLNLFTLGISPLPWTDEVVFADIVNNYIQFGKLNLNVVPQFLNGEVYVYGPVYFIMQKFFIYAAFMTAYSFRLLNYLFSIIVFGQFYFITKPYLNLKNFLILTLLLASDAVYIANSHSGRMDLIVLSFALFAFQFITQYFKNKKAFNLLLSAVFLSLCILTSPRGLFLLTPIIMIYIFNFNRISLVEKIKIPLLFLAVLLIFYVIYISTMVGSFQRYLQEFIDPSRQQHLAFTFWRETYEMPAIISCVVFSIVYLLKKINKKNEIYYFILINSITIILFLLFVKNIGPYTAMIIPFVYLNIIMIINSVFDKKYYRILIGFLLLINGSLCIVKFWDVLGNQKNRDVYNATYKDLENIKDKNVKVFSPFCFFYYCKNNNLKFENNEMYRISEDAYYRYIKKSGKSYILINNNLESKIWFKKLLANNELNELGYSRINDDENRFLKVIKSKLKINVNNNYEFKLYQLKN